MSEDKCRNCKYVNGDKKEKKKNKGNIIPGAKPFDTTAPVPDNLTDSSSESEPDADNNRMLEEILENSDTDDDSAIDDIPDLDDDEAFDAYFARLEAERRQNNLGELST